jgi:hypothetical protein
LFFDVYSVYFDSICWLQLQAALEAKEKDLEATQLETAKTKQQLLEEKEELKKVRIA